MDKILDVSPFGDLGSISKVTKGGARTSDFTTNKKKAYTYIIS